MSSRWEIQIPYRSRDDSLTAVMDAARALPPEERGVVRALVVGQIGNVSTAGELIDGLEELSPDQRRALLDQAREREDLKTSAAIDAEPIRHPPGNEGPRLQICAAEGCYGYPGYPGSWEMSDVRRWWCAAHRDQAEPGDMEPVPARYEIDPRTMSLRAVGAERERIEQEERERQEKLREEEERQERELEAIQAAKKRYADDDAAIQNVLGIRVRPDGRIADDRHLRP